MKCIVLAGGAGERLWPLSRKNCPKQFIEIENNHSVFQNTIARNIPFCDEFIIVTNVKYRYLLENQLKPFQGLNYRCIYETEAKKTTGAITLACLSLEPTEYVLVAYTNILISAPEYKDAIIEARKNAKEGYISLLVSRETETDSRFGYVTEKDGATVRKFIEKPLQTVTGEVYKNLGFLVFQNGTYLNSMPAELLAECKEAYKTRTLSNGNTFYGKVSITPVSVDKSCLERSDCLKAVEINFPYCDIRTLDDLTGYENKGVVVNSSPTNRVINTAKNKAVVVNGVENLMVVNTQDALYIGKNGRGMKYVLENVELQDYEEKSTLFDRSWGYYEDLTVEKDYRLRRVTINPGETIRQHVHTGRTESWTVIKGTGKFTINGEGKVCLAAEVVTARIGDSHQISNLVDTPLVLVETALGEILREDKSAAASGRLNDTELGLSIEPFVKVRPALKDYLWGGSRLKEGYCLESDLDVIAEAWELSAHPDGESVVTTGRHKGLTLSRYIDMVGKEALGWKCMPLKNFPMLVKFIDAKDNLSIQVHPNDDYAFEHENQFGKNEMWYVIDAEPGAGLYIGFNRDVDREEVARRVMDNTITEILNFYPTKSGDSFFIPAGTVHAICKGNLICEIQQSSNCTYRLYDYDRRDKFGRPRELHLRKALDVLNFNRYEAVQGKVSCKYFETEIVEVEEMTLCVNDDRFLSLVCMAGEGEISSGGYHLEIHAGDSFFIPAWKTVLQLKGKMKLAISHI